MCNGWVPSSPAKASHGQAAGISCSTGGLPLKLTTHSSIIPRYLPHSNMVNHPGRRPSYAMAIDISSAPLASSIGDKHVRFRTSRASIQLNLIPQSVDGCLDMSRQDPPSPPPNPPPSPSRALTVDDIDESRRRRAKVCHSLSYRTVFIKLTNVQV